MSKHTTLEQLKMLAQRSKSEIDKVDSRVTALSSRVDDIATVGGEPNVITEVKVNGASQLIVSKAVDITVPTKTSELNNDAKYQTEEEVAAAVAAADHLKRKIVTGTDDIDPAADDADQFIYMVPKADSDEDDLYDEYMVLNGKVEHVGNTKVDLTGYVKDEDIVFAADSEVTSMLDEVFGPAPAPEPPEEETEQTEP